MTEGSKRLVIYGYTKKKTKNTYPKTEEERRKLIASWERAAQSSDEAQKNAAKAKLKNLEDDADHDEIEFSFGQRMKLDYPTPLQKYFMTIENPKKSVEPFYYWCMHEINDLGYMYVDKLTDIFTAAEHSSFYGAAAQRLGLAQDKVSQYLAAIGKMIKDMFQLVRELRWIDERKTYYEQSDKTDAAMQALKGLWVDMVDGVVGGQRTGSNLFTMATQLQYSALPDLFFDVSPKKSDKVDEVVEEKVGEFNKNVKRVLKRKLYSFLTWRESTFKELLNRRNFTLKYLRQHYNVIRMYMTWCKPYIRHIERLKGSTERLESPDVIAAFESSMVDIEVLGRKIAAGNKKVYSCILMTFEYRTKPSMQYQTDAYHRGPIHIGITNMTFRSYTWTKEEIDKFKRMKEEEDLEMLKNIDESLTAAMEALGKDLRDYLREANEDMGEPLQEAGKTKKEGVTDVFAQPFKGIGELFGGLIPKGRAKGMKITKKSLALAAAQIKDEREKAKGDVKMTCFKLYDYFKKAHGMLAW